MPVGRVAVYFFFNDTATTEIYTLSLHDALPILGRRPPPLGGQGRGPHLHVRDGHALRGNAGKRAGASRHPHRPDRKSTRLNSSHANISYAVFCLKKKHRKPTLHTTKLLSRQSAS